MNLLDILIIFLALALAARGVASGLLRQIGSLGGFVAGLLLGAVVAVWVAHLMPNSAARTLVVLFVFFGLATLIGGIGEVLGEVLSGLAEQLHLRALDSLLGALFGVLITLFGAWLLAATFARTAGPALAAQIQNSTVLQLLDRSLPPAPDVLAQLERTLGQHGFPRVFAGLEPTPAPAVTGPNAAAVNAAAAAGRAATVKIMSEGCGGEIEGSGFVVGEGLVATNAHVVAGIDSPIIEDANGLHRGTVVVFDPDLDVAVLRTTNLAAAPLPLATINEPRGTVGAALGYPGGGPFTVSPAAILDRTTALGRNIYDTGLVRRDVYELQAVVRPGNSGGPLIDPSGTVIGIIFATSTVNGNLGYALTSAEVLPDIRQAATAGAVSTGACIAE